jgi:hypothetical protein
MQLQTGLFMMPLPDAALIAFYRLIASTKLLSRKVSELQATPLLQAVS